MRYAIIVDNTVTNIIEAEHAGVLPGVQLIEALPHTAIGDMLVDGALPPEPPEPAPDQSETITAQMADIEGQLAALDAQYLTRRVLAGLAVGDEFAQSQYEQHEELARPLRDQWQRLKQQLGGDR